jgi:hypothetical protein
MEQQHDQFGNAIEYENNGGRQTRVTRSSKNAYFVFMGKVYSYGILRQNEEVKVYYKSNKSDAILQRDSYGRFFLYFYDEYDFDRVDILWVLVDNEADADKMVGAARLSRIRIPFIAADGGNWLAAEEYVE